MSTFKMSLYIEFCFEKCLACLELGLLFGLGVYPNCLLQLPLPTYFNFLLIFKSKSLDENFKKSKVIQCEVQIFDILKLKTYIRFNF
jgi:hypothetical protein